MTFRDWGDRDSRHWTLRLDRGRRPVLTFASGNETFTLAVHCDAGLEDRSDRDLERLLDEGRGSGGWGESSSATSRTER